jgi:hypothetical protein
MKPLFVAPLTAEDNAIWDRVRGPFVFISGRLAPHPLAPISFTSDRYDAALMLAITRYAGYWDFSYPRCIKFGAHLAMKVREFKGGNVGDTFNITNCVGRRWI